MRFLHPDNLPRPVRTAGRMLLPAGWRSGVAAGLQELANLQYRLGRSYSANRRGLDRLRGTRSGAVCVIMGNGPSLRGFDVARLDGVDVFCLNRGYLLWNAARRSPRYVVAVNDLVIQQFAPELAAVDTTRFLPWDHADRFRGTDNLFLPLSWRRGFSRDIERGIWAGGTVTFAAMQIAYHIGYARVVLIGVDHSFVFEGKPNERLTASRPDPNHFDSDYFGDGVQWHAPDLALSETAYKMAGTAFAKDGREIVDATMGGRLQVFRKLSLAEALER